MILKFVNIKEQSASTQIYTFHILVLPACWVNDTEINDTEIREH